MSGSMSTIGGSMGGAINPLQHLLSNPWYANQVAGAVGYFMSDASKKAATILGQVETTIDELQRLIEKAIAAPNYNPQTGAISWAYAQPSSYVTAPNYSGLIPAPPPAPTEPTRVTMPEQGPLMTAAQSQAIFDRQRARTAADTAGLERQALYQAASLGIGLPTPTLVAGLREARERTLEAGMKVSADQAAYEATAAREDIAKIIAFQEEQYRDVMASGMSIANFLEEQYKDRSANVWNRLKAQEENMRTQITLYEARLRGEAERRAWNAGHVEMLLSQARDGADIYMKWALNQTNRLISAREVILQTYATLAQALLQMSDASLSFQGSQDVTTRDS